MNPPQTPPQSPRPQKYAKCLTRVKRLQVRALAQEGLIYNVIAKWLDITHRQVQYAMNTAKLTPKKSSGRNSSLTSAQMNEVENFITSSAEGRQMSYFEMSNLVFPHLGVSEKVIEREMKKRGYTCRATTSKPALSPENLTKRNEFARYHLHWEIEDWMQVLWIDESWVTNGRHTRCWITRKPDEVYDVTCVVNKLRRRMRWMFWGSFFGLEKGSCLFWEKEWSSITAERYSERIVSLIHGMVSLRPDLMVMQDNGPCHSAARTRRELRERNVFPIEWPPFSPDLNPIEHIWNLMKNFIQDKYPDVIEGRQRTGQETRIIVQEAWYNAVNEDDLRKLVESMPQRVKAVYDAGGGHVKH